MTGKLIATALLYVRHSFNPTWTGLFKWGNCHTESFFYPWLKKDIQYTDSDSHLRFYFCIFPSLTQKFGVMKISAWANLANRIPK